MEIGCPKNATKYPLTFLRDLGIISEASTPFYGIVCLASIGTR
jgi:hypothetical protein